MPTWGMKLIPCFLAIMEYAFKRCHGLKLAPKTEAAKFYDEKQELGY